MNPNNPCEASSFVCRHNSKDVQSTRKIYLSSPTPAAGKMQQACLQILGNHKQPGWSLSCFVTLCRAQCHMGRCFGRTCRLRGS